MHKKVFISYSWGNKEHQDWVQNLGTRLMYDTVDVVLDRWSLKEGHDIHAFMEEMVKAEDIFRVLILSDKKYKEKADSREGGVGTETQIITPNIYQNQKQEKFIPIVLERDEKGQPFLPIYLLSRKYIDFSLDEKFEDSYEELLRNILEAPSLPKPKLGIKPPAYITENALNLSETSTKLRIIANKKKNNVKISLSYLNDFIDVFLDKLWEFRINYEGNDLTNFGDAFIEKYKLYKPLREDFIQFVNLTGNIETIEDSDFLINFFEVSSRYSRPKDEKENSYKPSDFDIFKVIFQELFLYTISICLKNKSYSLVADLLHSRYYKADLYSSNPNPEMFTFLGRYHENIENYMRKNYNKISGFGDIIISNLSPQVSKEEFILADVLCYFVSYLDKEQSYFGWFPRTYLYLRSQKLLFFEKITSKKHFENVKEIFNVSNIEEFKAKMNKAKTNERDRISYNRGFDEIPFIYELVKPETIGIYR